MARKLRAEVEGGLYHVITRGNNRRQIFNSPADYEQFLSLLAVQKVKLPFFLYAYSLMTNHVHLLIERRADAVGRIMHRVLTGYSQYYNRRYRRVGHLLQGRHRAILCQSDRYLAELVRYIHLNPVRAKIVDQPEQYQYSGHRAYLGLEPAWIVDVDPVLRHFGAKKKLAREAYRQFVAAGMKLSHQEEFYVADGGRILGTEEFVDATIHRIGEAERAAGNQNGGNRDFDAEALMRAVEKICRVGRAEFCGSGKSRAAVTAKEMFALIGCQDGASLKLLSEITGMSSATVSRRCEAARLKVREMREIGRLAETIRNSYLRR
ncbi:MAG TPA: transposase [Blastocatellia bacterium]|nr:transposase [Blastocatellia bacterium]